MPRSIARSRPTSSIAGVRSHTVTVDSAARSRMRKAISPGAAGHVEEILPVLGIEPVDHRRFPQAMDAAGHQIVHQVVFGGNRGKRPAPGRSWLRGRRGENRFVRVWPDVSSGLDVHAYAPSILRRTIAARTPDRLA